MTLKEKLVAIDEQITKLKSFNTPNQGLIDELEYVKATLQKKYEDSDEFKAEQEAKELLDSLSSELNNDEDDNDSINSINEFLKSFLKDHEIDIKDFDANKIRKNLDLGEINSKLLDKLSDLKFKLGQNSAYKNVLRKQKDLTDTIKETEAFKKTKDTVSHVIDKAKHAVDEAKSQIESKLETSDNEFKEYLSENELRILEENFGELYVTESSTGEFGIILPSYNLETEFVFDEHHILIEINKALESEEDGNKTYYEYAYEVNPDELMIDIKTFVINFEEITKMFESEITKDELGFLL